MAAKKAPEAPKPERVIMLLAGETGSGKSFFVANLRHALIFDTDIGGGLSYADERIRRNGSVRIEVGSYPEIIDHLRKTDLAAFNTVAIDHLSTLHQEGSLRYNPQMIRDFGAASDKATKEWRKIRELIRWRDFHLVCTSHLKGKWQDEKVIGMQADASKQIEGDFHIVLHTRCPKPNTYPGVAEVIKWRRDPEDSRGRVPSSFPFTLDKFLAIHGLPLEVAREEVLMASTAEVGKLNKLLEAVKLPEGTVEKWLSKAKAETFADMTQETIMKCIHHLNEIIAKSKEGESAA